MRTSITLLIFLYTSLSTSQTGPAGVGNSGTNALWLKADAGTSSSVNTTPISSWNDQSGNGLDVSQGTANQQPLFATNVINGFPAIQFDNVSTTNDKLIGPDSPLLDNTAGYTFLMVTRPQNVDNNARVILSKRTGVAINQSFMQFFFTGSKFFTDLQTNNDRYNTVAGFVSNTNYLITQWYDGTLASALRCRTYIADALDITSAETSTFVPDNASPLVIGSTDSGDPRPFGGYMAEIIIYRAALNDASRIIVSNYLSAKYNIALAANDKYQGDNAGNGDYDREVAGVGQEPSGSSTSFSASVTGGLTMVVTAGLDNGDYILAGHALAVNAPILSDVGGMSGTYNARWQRIWYVDVTNASTAITTNIEFDMSDGGMGLFTLGSASDYVLLYRAGQSGNWTEITTGSSIVGDRILFNGVVLTNDGYYTLGTKNFNGSPLPVELLYFEAKTNKHSVELFWSTASEKNSDHFEVERTRDGSSTDLVNVIPSHGNSSELNTYSAYDLLPYDGVSYYRLKEVSTSGTGTHSKWVAITLGEEPGIKVFPNPPQALLHVQTFYKTNTSITIQITETSGKVCYTLSTVTKTDNEIQHIETNRFIPGTYIISVSADHKVLYKTIIIK